MYRYLTSVLAALVVVAVGCTSSSTGANRVLVNPEVLSATEVPATTTTQPPVTSTSTTTSRPPPASTALLNACPAEGAASEVPAEVRERLDSAVSHSGFEGLDVSVSAWVDGWGEVVSVNPDLVLAPASNQKLLVAIAAYETLDLDASLRTAIELSDDALVLRAGADPTLTIDHVSTLATQVADAGVTDVSRLVIDISPYGQEPRATGWLDWQIPTYVGPLSGFMIDNNRWTNTPDFVAEPTLLNGRRVASQLLEAGVSVGEVTVGWAPPGEVVAVHLSPTIGEMVRTMLLWSDNQHADLLLMELGRARGRSGTLEGGAEVVDEVLRGLCIAPTGVSNDGSGLSRANLRSAREFQQILRVLRPDLRSQLLNDLPIGGRSGTMNSRFGSDPDRVYAKTGTIIGGRALTGFASTDDGRDFVFSVIVNGESGAASASLSAIDGLITTLLRGEA